MTIVIFKSGIGGLYSVVAGIGGCRLPILHPPTIPVRAENVFPLFQSGQFALVVPIIYMELSPIKLRQEGGSGVILAFFVHMKVLFIAELSLFT